MTSAVLTLPVWTPDFCDTVRRAMDDGDAEAAEIVDRGFTVDTMVRRAFDVTVEPLVLERVERALADVRPRVEQFFRVPLGGSVGVTFLRYLAGGQYLRHCDCDPTPGSGTEQRRVSVIAWLNSADSGGGAGDFSGGTLRLYEPGRADPHELIPTTGTLVAFPSEWPHEVVSVTRGVRDVVVDWWLAH